MNRNILCFLWFLMVSCSLVFAQEFFVKREGELEITYRSMTLEDLDRMKESEGIYQEGRNYNLLIEGYGTGLRPPTLEEWQRILQNGLMIERVVSGGPLRAAVDHSTSQYFPPIGNQGSQGSCVSWATGYYTKTFQEAQDQNWNLTGTTWNASPWPGTLASNQDKIFTPAFLYNQVNNGVDGGSAYQDNMQVIYINGICTWNNKPYNHNDYTSWPSETAWRQAPLYRGNSACTQMDVNTDAGITNLKNWLAGNNCAVISIDANKYNQLVLISGKGDVWTYDVDCVASRNHANTVIGYDDNFGPYTEEGATRYGAFKIANSWGKGGWSGDNDADGMLWISYEAMKRRVLYCYTFTDKVDYNPNKIAVFQLTHTKRDECEITLGQGSSSSPTFSKRFENYYYRGGAHPFPSNVMVLDVTEFTSRANYFIKVFDRTTTTTTGTINSFKIETYSGPYTPGSPSQTYPSTETPLNTQNNASVVANINADDTVYISINDVSITEGNTGSANVTFTVSLSKAATSTVTVNYATANGTAAAGADYTATSGTLSFAVGETSKPVSVAVLGDTMDEPNETFYVNLSGAANATISDSQGVATINDNDNAPSISINDTSVLEGDSGQTNVNLTVTLSNASAYTVSVDYITANGVASAGSDYIAASGTISFSAGETSKPITIAVLGDTVAESNETFYVNLSGATNATIADNQGIVTITDNDNAPSISINDVSVTEGNTGSINANLTVSLSNGSSSTVTVNYATANNTATSGADYTALSGTLSFSSGETSKTISVAVLGDTIDEPNETFYVNLSGATNATIADNQGIVTITDNDNAPALSINDVSITEGDSGQANVNFTVSLSNASSSTVTVNYATANGTATAGADYTTVSGTLSFAAGETSKLIAVPVMGDLNDEPNETFYVNLSSATNATISDSQGMATINDNDSAPSISIDDVSVTEGNTGSANVSLTVSLSNASGYTVTVNYATANGTALSGSDYTAASGTLSFSAGQTTKTVSVAVLGDTINEPNEAFYVNLSTATNATIADSQGIVTILDNDGAPSISINDVSITEGNTGSANATLTVSLSNASSSTVTVVYGTVDNTATAGADYTAASGTITFAAGETSKSVSVPVLGDTLDEPNETFYVNLSNPTNATISDSQGIVTITDNDNPPAITINDASVTEGNTGQANVTLSVSLSNPSSYTVTVNYATANNTATSGSDYMATSGTLSFLPGEIGKTIPIAVLGDTLDELNETFYVNLSGATNATISDGQGVVTITDDDSTTLSINDASVVEGDSGSSNVTLTVTLSIPSSSTVTVNYATANNTAASGSDYTATSGTLSFAAGETSKPITVAVLGDILDEPNETFYVNLSGATNATISDSQGIVTITDNDNTPSLSINDASITEGNSGSANVTLTVTLSNPSSSTVTVNYATANSTATAGSDYTATSGTLSFTTGQTSKTITVAVLGDTTDEANETFYVNLSGAANATISDGQGAVTIIDNDGTPTLSINDTTITEGDSGSANVTLTVTLSNASSSTVTVKYATANGTATAGSDYTAVSGTLSFSPGQTSKTIPVAILGDNVAEAHEVFYVNLSAPTEATIADGQGVVTINDNDTPVITLNDVTVTEGTSAVLTLTLSKTSTATVSVKYATANNTALAGSDYTAMSGTISFSPGTSTKTLSIPTTNDTLDEPDTETFTVNLSNPTNATIGDSQGIVTLNDNDNPPGISIKDATVAEGGTATLTVSLSNGSSYTVTVNYATANGTAVAGSDYTSTSGTISFSPGTTSKTITVPTLEDISDEPVENFYMNLSNPTHATIADGQGVVTLNDNDSTPAITLNDVTVTEGDSGQTNATFTVKLSNPSGSTVTVKYATTDGTAKAGKDYTAVSDTLSFNPGETAKTLSVPVLGDTVDEAHEVFYVNLSGAVNSTIADAKGQATITDDDPNPSVSINDVMCREGNSGSTYAIFIATLSKASEQTIAVKYKTTDGTALAGKDYTAKSGTVTVPPGMTTVQIPVTVLGESVYESNETFYVDLLSATNATLLDARGICTLENDDTGVDVNPVSITVAEGNASRDQRSTAVFTIVRSGIIDHTTTVSYKTANGTAIAGNDYQAASGNVTFYPGETSKTASVVVYGDDVDEANETFDFLLTGATNGTIGVGKGTATILDDDATPEITISDVTVKESTGASVSATFIVKLSRASGSTVTVKYTTANGTAEAGKDYLAKYGTLSFKPGTLSQTFTVSVLGDTEDAEGSETFYVNLSQAVNAVILDGQGVCTIVDDDTALRIADVSGTEGNPARSPQDRAKLTFTVTRSGVTTHTSTVNYATANGTAMAGLDYEAQSGFLTFGPGVTNQNITVTILGDNLYEPGDEYFYVKLSKATNALIKVAQAKGTILDDDPQPKITIDDATVTEGTGTNVSAIFMVKLSVPSAQTVTVKYQTANVTAIAGQDYVAKSGTLTFAPNTTSQSLMVSVIGDNVAENDETFRVVLSAPVKATLLDSEAIGTINDNDTDLEILNTSVNEGHSGIVNALFTVRRTGLLSYNSTVQYKTADGTAKAGSDYEAASGIVTFGASENEKTIAVTVYGDTRREYPSEIFYVNLSTPTGARIKTGKAQCTINDDDPSPAITINNVTVVEPDAGSVYAKFTVSLGSLSNDTVSVKYATANNTATAPADYTAKSGTLTFTPGMNKIDILVSVRGDLVAEPNETFYVNLSNAQNASISDGQGVCTITKTRADYDGDGKADFSVYLQDEQTWHALKSRDNHRSSLSSHWDNAEVLPVPGDYDGDGKTDMAVWNRTTGEWLCVNSSDLSYLYKHWGIPGAGRWVPVPGDYDGDGKTDMAVWNKSTGEWFCLNSSDHFNSFLYKTWGVGDSCDFTPVPGDYDGDGKTDMAVWNKSTGEWFCLNSSDHFNSFLYKTWGVGEREAFLPVPEDYDGDGKTDMAVWNKSTGEWFVLKSSDGYESCLYRKWGVGKEYLPLPADYDGDGKLDFSVWQKSTGAWHCLLSSTGYVCHVWKFDDRAPLFPVSMQQHILSDIYASKHPRETLTQERIDALQNRQEAPGSLDPVLVPHELPGKPGPEFSSHFPGTLGDFERAENCPGPLGMEMYGK